MQLSTLLFGTIFMSTESSRIPTYHIILVTLWCSRAGRLILHFDLRLKNSKKYSLLWWITTKLISWWGRKIDNILHVFHYFILHNIYSRFHKGSTSNVNSLSFGNRVHYRWKLAEIRWKFNPLSDGCHTAFCSDLK